MIDQRLFALFTADFIDERGHRMESVVVRSDEHKPCTKTMSIQRIEKSLPVLR